MKALMMLLVWLSVSAAHAGDWAYGCVGHANNLRITFDRGQLVTMPEKLAQADLDGLIEDNIRTWDAADANSGFQTTMTFTHVYSPSETQTAVLTEKASKVLSNKTQSFPCTGGRERDVTKTKTQKTYELILEQGTQPVTVQMQCFEYLSTACG